MSIRNGVRAPRDVRDARQSREDVEESLEHLHQMQDELRLTIMQSRIRLAALMATLRCIGTALDTRH